jgi:hypothetical protein
MTTIVDGTSGITFPNSTTQSSAGKVLQVISTTLSTTTTSISNGTGVVVTGLNSTITPQFSTSKILIQLNMMYGTNGLVTTYGGYFTRNGTIIGVGNAGSGQQQVGFGLNCTGDGNQVLQASYGYLDSPATTSALTYQVYVINDNNIAIYINRSTNDTGAAVGKRGISTITLMEIAV